MNGIVEFIILIVFGALCMASGYMTGKANTMKHYNKSYEDVCKRIIDMVNRMGEKNE